VRFDVAIANYNTAHYLLHLLRSMRDAFPGGFGGVCHVWDNGSSDESRVVLDELGRELPWLAAHHGPVNLQHGPALDRLLRDHCRADWVLVLDSDTRVRHDFRAALPALAGEAPAFIGQVHPEVSQLYAYMCHLLVNRSWYAELPPFDADGAPGRAFFAAVAARGVHWRRFRWMDHVDHYGQGTLRRLVERRETAHPLYRFAAEQGRRDGHGVEAAARERALCRELAHFLAGRGLRAAPAAEAWPSDPPPATAGPAPAARASAGLACGAPAPALLAPPARPLTVREAFVFSPAARLVRIAVRLGLDHRPSELARLVRRVRRRRPRVVVEVGRPAGGTLFLWTRAASARATLVSAGPPPWEPDDPGEAARRGVLSSFARPLQRLHVLRDDPLLPSTRAHVGTLLAGRPADFLFVTGEVEVEQVRGCLEVYARLVRPGGLIAVDGIRPRLGGSDCVARFWTALRRAARARELVEDARQPGFGIGLIRAGTVPSAAWGGAGA
jgi:hypothetical protein